MAFFYYMVYGGISVLCHQPILKINYVQHNYVFLKQANKFFEVPQMT